VIHASHPKPPTRKAEKEKQRARLREYRREQYQLAIDRDGGLCRMCGRMAADVHHVYGRGKRAGDWREHHDNLICVCRQCHPHGYKKR
jgi:hypothetical protein